jgi:hypothetical protein
MANWKQDQGSHLFTVRLWSESLEDHKGWRGRVQHVLSGETRTFDDWSSLVDIFLEMAETDRIEVAQPQISPTGIID